MTKSALVLWFLLFASVLVGLRGLAQAQPLYTTADFKGSYGIGVSGTVIFTPPATGPAPDCSNWTAVSLPIAITGILTANGTGGLTGTETFNAQGEVCVGTTAGKYNVDSNGTGTFSVTFTPNSGQPEDCVSSAGTVAFTFANGVNQLDLTGTDCYQVTSGTAIKQ
jgi:hypothetical protein